MTTMDPDEFDRRGRERRERRDYPPGTDWVSVVLGCTLFCLVIFWVVWGVMR